MSLHRRITAGLPVAGLTLFTVLSLSGAPASAAVTADAPARIPAAAATTNPDDTRGGNGYGSTADTDTPDVADTAGPDDTAPDTDTPDTDTPTRGQNGYGTPSATPSASTDTVPPGVSPSSATPSASTPGGGVSPAHTLPVTGAPMGLVIALGALMVAAGAGSVWYTRRRRSA